MEDGRDKLVKLVNLADTMHKEAEDKTYEELIEPSEEVLYNKGNVQNMAKKCIVYRQSRYTDPGSIGTG
jgi:hypothetical protein